MRLTRKTVLLSVAVTGAVAAGAGAAVLATQATVTDTITVPYTIAGQTGQVVVTHEVDVPTVTSTQTDTVTQTVTVTVTSPTTTTDTTPTDTTPTTTTTSPPPPETISPSTFAARATTGATLENLTVTGDVIVRNANVTLRNVAVQGDIEFYSGANGAKMLGSSADSLFIWGPDNVLVDGNVFDGHNSTLGGKMWDMGGNVSQNVTISNNTFRNQQTGNSADHSQAMFVGYSNGVTITGNTFVNNGSTADLFFSWWADSSPSSSRTYPRNVCVKGNSFSDPNDLHYFAINFRSEIKTSANIVTDPNEPGFSTTSPQFNGTC
jgi:hypothetical protein